MFVDRIEWEDEISTSWLLRISTWDVIPATVYTPDNGVCTKEENVRNFSILDSGIMRDHKFVRCVRKVPGNFNKYRTLWTIHHRKWIFELTNDFQNVPISLIPFLIWIFQISQKSEHCVLGGRFQFQYQSEIRVLIIIVQNS